MSETELLDFLLLPGFSMREQAGPISGRGIGLDVVADAVRRLNGSLRVETRPGQGFATLITLPLSQSMLRALVVRAGGELLALPAAGVNRVMRIARSEVRSVGPRQYVSLEQTQVDLIPLAPMLDLDSAPAGAGESLEVVLIGDANQCHGLVVDELVCEQQLVVQALEPALGKVRDVSAAALLKGGDPVLILDLTDLLQGIRKRAAEGSLQRVSDDPGESPRAAKRVLVVDDSLTVREMQRKLLQTRGYDVELAVDGMDGWNAVRSGRFDLVITDVDMPRVDGIELVSLIKNDDRLRNLPVMIVSYKDRPEDRTRGIDAGADYYLAKGTFHDTTLLDAVADLIGDSRR